MAKKISKHSRAARRGEVGVQGEARELQKLPSEERNDVRKSIIRTTIKNENLLAKKMELDKFKKRGNKKLNNSLKHKSEKTLKLEGVLATKIQQSIEKARYVQAARKAGWDQINSSINLKPASALGEERQESEKELESKREEEYVKEFFTEANEGEQAAPAEPQAPKKSANPFDLLGETEC